MTTVSSMLPMVSSSAASTDRAGEEPGKQRVEFRDPILGHINDYLLIIG